MKQVARQFLIFGILSGIGWLLDLSTFVFLTKVCSVPISYANIASSYVGITFVWFASIKKVFRAYSGRWGGALFVYWAYQAVSILFYSGLIAYCANRLPGLYTTDAIVRNAGVICKVLATPVNLVTNFIFMKALSVIIERLKSGRHPAEQK